MFINERGQPFGRRAIARMASNIGADLCQDQDQCQYQSGRQTGLGRGPGRRFHNPGLNVDDKK